MLIVKAKIACISITHNILLTPARLVCIVFFLVYCHTNRCKCNNNEYLESHFAETPTHRICKEKSLATASFKHCRFHVFGHISR